MLNEIYKEFLKQTNSTNIVLFGRKLIVPGRRGARKQKGSEEENGAKRSVSNKKKVVAVKSLMVPFFFFRVMSNVKNIEIENINKRGR